MAQYGAPDRGLSNRDRARDAAQRRMPQHGVGLKKIETFGTSHKSVRRRGGIRGAEDAVRNG